MAKNTRKKKPSELTPAENIKELVICLVVAVVLAVIIKFVLVEVFVIPTGSMEPTLHGRPDGGDRVFCTKVDYRWRNPERWEIIVFKFPYDYAMERDLNSTDGLDIKYKNQNFIKRCIGLPGETVLIRRGDIFTNVNGRWERQVKSDRVLRSLWIPVYYENFSNLKKIDLQNFWIASNLNGWNLDKGSLEIDTPKRLLFSYRPRIRSDYKFSDVPMTTRSGIPDRYIVRQAVTFKCKKCGKEFRTTVMNQKIAARCPHCGTYQMEDSVEYYARRSDIPKHGGPGDGFIKQGETTRSTQYSNVPDLRLAFKITPSPKSKITLSLRDDDSSVNVTLKAGAPGELTFEREEIGQSPAPFPRQAISFEPDKVHTVEFYVADGMARLFVDSDDKPVFEQQAKPLSLDYNDITARSADATGASFAVTGKATIDDIVIDRDIYYFQIDRPAFGEKDGTFRLRDGEFLALGDNCPSSHDSRGWGPVPKSNMMGPALFVWWPPHRAHWLIHPFGIHVRWYHTVGTILAFAMFIYVLKKIINRLRSGGKEENGTDGERESSVPSTKE